jgi:Na+/H+ antiporter NhaD/arsenite permease-like protein
MESVQIIALLVFLASIALIIWGRLERSVVGIVGVVLMVVFGVMSETQAFLFVDWNIIAILFSIWIIAGYFSRTGIPQYLAVTMLRLSRNNIALFLVLLGGLSGFMSMFIDNVVVILMMAPVILHLTRRLKLPSFPFLIYVGLASNFMGTALLLGDLPPQMLHSVAGIEFHEFIWQMGRPSSFIILTVTFLITTFILYHFKFKKRFAGNTINRTVLEKIASEDPAQEIKNKNYAIVVVAVFAATIIAMSFRELTGLHLGFIALAGMIVLVVIMEVFRKPLASPDFEQIIDEMEMKTLIFYVTLFALVGAINHAGIIGMIAGAIAGYIEESVTAGATVVYWVTVPVVGVVEHDAYILAFLYLIKDLAFAANIDPWPLWWALLWAGTLGSNLTVAGAPALLVALNICEKEDVCRIGLREFFSYTVPFVAVTLVICYILMLFIWVLPFA